MAVCYTIVYVPEEAEYWISLREGEDPDIKTGKFYPLYSEEVENLEDSRNIGNTGNTASTGNIGDTGSTGDTGRSGNIMDAGNTGKARDVGNTGNAGNAGNLGNAGNIMDVGNTGKWKIWYIINEKGEKRTEEWMRRRGDYIVL